jgi:hypothetical protein
MSESFIVTAWNNGQHHKSGAGYGLKVTEADRDHYFRRNWSDVELELEGHDRLVNVNVDKPSFWNGTCREMISKEIGRWLQANDLHRWPDKKPHKLRMTHISGNRFKVSAQPEPRE